MQTATIDGRPASIMFINNDFEPVDEADATLIRVNFTDEAGGSAFLVRTPDVDQSRDEEELAVMTLLAHGFRRDEALLLLGIDEGLEERDWRDQDRVPAGSPEGGQFGSGGGGSGGNGSAAPSAPAATSKPAEVPRPPKDASVQERARAGVERGAAKASAAGVKPLSGSVGHPNLIATRYVSAKGTDKSIYTRPDVQSMTLGQEKYAEDAALFRNADIYPNFRPGEIAIDDPSASLSERMQAANKTVDNVKAHMKENLRALWDTAGEKAQQDNRRWYDGARTIVDAKVDEHDLNDASVAGVYAALSPQKDWNENVYLGNQLIDTYQTKQNFAWDEAMSKTGNEIWTKPDHAAIMKGIEGKTLAQCETTTEKAIWIRTYNQAHTDRSYRLVNPDGTLGDVATAKSTGKPTPARWNTVTATANAIRCLEANGDPEKISDALGERHKVRSFFNNILDPNSANQDVTIDSHAVGAGLFRPLGSDSPAYWQASYSSPDKAKKPPGWQAASGSAITGLYGVYPVYADAVRELASELGVQPRELQSVTWEMKRSLFPQNMLKSQKDGVAAAWREYHIGNATLADTQKAVIQIARTRPKGKKSWPIHAPN